MGLQYLLYFISFVAVLVLPSCSDKGAFSYVVSSSAELDPVYGVRLDSTVPAVDLALEYINNNSTLLPGITLSYGQVTQLQVLYAHVLVYCIIYRHGRANKSIHHPQLWSSNIIYSFIVHSHL